METIRITAVGDSGEERASSRAKLTAQSPLAQVGNMSQLAQAVALESLDGCGCHGALWMQVKEESNGNGRQKGGHGSRRDEGERSTNSGTQTCKLCEREAGADTSTRGDAEGLEPPEEIAQHALCFGIRADAEVEQGTER